MHKYVIKLILLFVNNCELKKTFNLSHICTSKKSDKNDCKDPA